MGSNSLRDLQALLEALESPPTQLSRDDSVDLPASPDEELLQAGRVMLLAAVDLSLLSWAGGWLALHLATGAGPLWPANVVLAVVWILILIQGWPAARAVLSEKGVTWRDGLVITQTICALLALLVSVIALVAAS